MRRYFIEFATFAADLVMCTLLFFVLAAAVAAGIALVMMALGLTPR